MAAVESCARKGEDGQPCGKPATYWFHDGCFSESRWPWCAECFAAHGAADRGGTMATFSPMSDPGKIVWP